jgi:hypothetical protein
MEEEMFGLHLESSVQLFQAQMEVEGKAVQAEGIDNTSREAHASGWRHCDCATVGFCLQDQGRVSFHTTPALPRAGFW